MVINLRLVVLSNYMKYQNSLSFAKGNDEKDPLKSFRSLFNIPTNSNGEQQIYFCGNSLGLAPVSVEELLDEVVSQWKRKAVESWFHGDNPWIDSHKNAKRILSSLVGAHDDEIAIANSLSVNLHLLLLSFYKPTTHRYKIIIEADAFPSDVYIVKSQIRFHGYDVDESLVIIRPDKKGYPISKQNIDYTLEKHGNETAVFLISGVNYSTGQVFDLESIAQLGKFYGCMVGLDLAHAIGNIPLNLHNWGIDFAAWCHYKYMNAGPGSIAGMFVHRDHHESQLPKLHGWWGSKSESKFLMRDEFEEEKGAESWVMSTPSQLNMAALYSSLEIFDKTDINSLRTKSITLSGYLAYLINTLNNPNLKIITPLEPKFRGCQISIKIKYNGKAIFERLIAADLICDWREPNIIRLSPTPLYNTYAEVYKSVQVLKTAVSPQKMGL